LPDPLGGPLPARSGGGIAGKYAAEASAGDSRADGPPDARRMAYEQIFSR